MSFKCPYCEESFIKITKINAHVKRVHKKTSKDLYLELHCNNVEPMCKCGCKNPVKFLGIIRGFREYRKGHVARVKNNWGHNKKALEKSQEKRRQMHKDGEITIWNKGLSKETDERVAINGIRGGITIRSNKEELKRRSERMSKNRKNGILKTFRGPESPVWKGGISPLNNLCRSNKKFYNEWTFIKLKDSNFECQECGSNQSKDKKVKLQVHHDKETFAEILNKVAANNNWIGHTAVKLEANNHETLELKTKISNEVAKYHSENNVSGIVLCENCHKKKHANMNF